MRTAAVWIRNRRHLADAARFCEDLACAGLTVFVCLVDDLAASSGRAAERWQGKVAQIEAAGPSNPSTGFGQIDFNQATVQDMATVMARADVVVPY